MPVSFQIILEHLQTIQSFSILSLHSISFNVAHKNFPMKTIQKNFFINFCGSVLVLCLMYCSNVSKLWETRPGALQLCVKMLPGLEVQPHGTAHHEGKALPGCCALHDIYCVCAETALQWAQTGTCTTSSIYLYWFTWGQGLEYSNWEEGTPIFEHCNPLLKIKEKNQYCNLKACWLRSSGQGCVSGAPSVFD